MAPKTRRCMMKKVIITLVLLFCVSSGSYAYLEDYPPYKFRDGPPKRFCGESLVDYDKADYTSSDSKVSARLKCTADTLDFIVRDDKAVLVSMKDKEAPIPFAVYRADLDGNGLKDFIVLYTSYGCGLAALSGMIEIYLKTNEGAYRKISYEALGFGIEDFVDMNNDGKCEVIIPDFYYGGGHNYFTYSIYEFNDFKLVNADSKFKGFPKFVWYTHKPNDKDTGHLSREERAAQVSEKNNSIEYSDVK